MFVGPPVVHALRPTTFRVDPGEYVAVTGPSGSGKSTLLSLLGLLDEPSAGRYLLNGIDVAELNDRDRAAVRAHSIGFVFQAFHLVGHRSVADNIELGLVYQGVGRRARRQRAREVIDQVGLQHCANTPTALLSGGERQRVAIARALVRRPALVLCDEPTGNLDSTNSLAVLDLLEDIHANGLTIMIITHDAGVAARAQRQFIIVDGVVSERERATAS
jgi:putative ABC transport system ATP-binding protein